MDEALSVSGRFWSGRPVNPVSVMMRALCDLPSKAEPFDWHLDPPPPDEPALTLVVYVCGFSVRGDLCLRGKKREPGNPGRVRDCVTVAVRCRVLL